MEVWYSTKCSLCGNEESNYILRSYPRGVWGPCYLHRNIPDWISIDQRNKYLEMLVKKKEEV